MRLGKFRDLMDERSREIIVGALTYCDGDREKAAKLVDFSRSQIYRLIRVHGLDEPSSGNGKEGMNWI